MFIFRSIPVSAIGKLDKKKLPSVKFDEHEDEGSPMTATERALAQLWCEVLGVKHVDTQESFFDLGGYVLKRVNHKTRLRLNALAFVRVQSFLQRDPRI